MLKTMLKTHIVIWVKIKKSLIKKDVIYKSYRSKKTGTLIKDFIETRKRIKDSFVSRKVGESDYQTGLTKLFKPITETQKATTKEITEAQKATAEKFASELLPIKEGVERLPLQVFNQIFPALKYKDSEITELGVIAVNALIEAFTKDGIDRAYGIYAKDKRFYMGNKKITIKDNDITIDDITYTGTPGLWKLITEKNIPNKLEFTPQDLVNYIYMMHQTKTTYVGNDPSKAKRGGSSKKLNKLIKPLVLLIEEGKQEDLGNKIIRYFEEKDEDEEEDDPQPSTSGTGLTILPSDPNALIDRFDLLFNSQKAGHTGVRNEIISILDKLKRQGVINTNVYKKLNSIIKK